MNSHGTEFDMENSDFQEEWLSAYLDDELSPEQRLVVEQHLSSNPAAQALLVDLQRIRKLVVELPDWNGPQISVPVDQLTIEPAPASDPGEDAGRVSEGADDGLSDDADGAEAGDVPSESESLATLEGDFEIDVNDLTNEEFDRGASVSQLDLENDDLVDSPRPVSYLLLSRWRPLAVAASVLVMGGLGYALWSENGIRELASNLSRTVAPSAEADSSVPDTAQSEEEFPATRPNSDMSGSDYKSPNAAGIAQQINSAQLDEVASLADSAASKAAAPPQLQVPAQTPISGGTQFSERALNLQAGGASSADDALARSSIVHDFAMPPAELNAPAENLYSADQTRENENVELLGDRRFSGGAMGGGGYGGIARNEPADSDLAASVRSRNAVAEPSEFRYQLDSNQEPSSPSRSNLVRFARSDAWTDEQLSRALVATKALVGDSQVRQMISELQQETLEASGSSKESLAFNTAGAPQASIEPQGPVESVAQADSGGQAGEAPILIARLATAPTENAFLGLLQETQLAGAISVARKNEQGGWHFTQELAFTSSTFDPLSESKNQAQAQEQLGIVDGLTYQKPNESPVPTDADVSAGARPGVGGQFDKQAASTPDLNSYFQQGAPQAAAGRTPNAESQNSAAPSRAPQERMARDAEDAIANQNAAQPSSRARTMPADATAELPPPTISATEGAQPQAGDASVVDKAIESVEANRNLDARGDNQVELRQLSREVDDLKLPAEIEKLMEGQRNQDRSGMENPAESLELNSPKNVDSIGAESAQEDSNSGKRELGEVSDAMEFSPLSSPKVRSVSPEALRKETSDPEVEQRGAASETTRPYAGQANERSDSEPENGIILLFLSRQEAEAVMRSQYVQSSGERRGLVITHSDGQETAPTTESYAVQRYLEDPSLSRSADAEAPLQRSRSVSELPQVNRQSLSRAQAPLPTDRVILLLNGPTSRK